MGKIFRFLNSNENIIAIRNRDIHEADEAFAEFMQMAEDGFNDRSNADPQLYKNITAAELEVETERLLKEIAPVTPFRPEEIKLVSGHSFPDVMAEKYYGVEVKSTQSSKWTSTGSSIVESTRDVNVENIYMLFGRLGGNPPEFRCRPYEDCLSNIAVTHSPRYMIDMEIRDRQEETIFEKLKIPYKQFCNKDDKIEVIRNYYIQQARNAGKHEMPWWVGGKTLDSDENTAIPPITLMADHSAEERRHLNAQMAILFPRVLIGDYADAALWLCTHRYILNLNFRDSFSAGGQWKKLNGVQLEYSLPAVVGKLQDLMPYILAHLNHDQNLEYQEFNSELYLKENKVDLWLKQVEQLFNSEGYHLSDQKIILKDFMI